MRTVGALILIVFAVVLSYILLMMFQPAINTMVETANASANYTNFPGAQEVIVGWPFWSYLVPGGLGLIAVIITLKAGKK